LLYDRLIRRFQSREEREAESNTKGYAGILEADIRRSEARLDAVECPDASMLFSYRHGPDGEIIQEDRDDVPADKEEAMERWKFEMEMRFVRGDDTDFDYKLVDNNEDYDDCKDLDQRREDTYFDGEEPRWELPPGDSPTGESGIQDY